MHANCCVSLLDRIDKVKLIIAFGCINIAFFLYFNTRSMQWITRNFVSNSTEETIVSRLILESVSVNVTLFQPDDITGLGGSIDDFPLQRSNGLQKIVLPGQNSNGLKKTAHTGQHSNDSQKIAHPGQRSNGSQKLANPGQHSNGSNSKKITLPRQSINGSQKKNQRMCPDLLSGMARGRWIKRNLSSEEEAEITTYLKAARGEFHIPPTFQRADGRCGNVAYEGSPQYRHMWFMAICDREGKTPCCKNERCVSLSEDQCQCSSCYDERPAIHAEYSQWQPGIETCHINDYSPTQACRLLHGSTISFVGDSFIRHIFVAMVILLTGNKQNGALRSDLTPLQRKKCSGWNQITGLTCRELLVEERSLCGGTVSVDYTEVFPAKQLPFAVHTLQSNSRKNKSLTIVSLGIHDDFRADIVTDIFLKPFLNIHQWLSQHPGDIHPVIDALMTFKTNINVENNFSFLHQILSNHFNNVMSNRVMNVYNSNKFFSNNNNNNKNKNNINITYVTVPFSYDPSHIQTMLNKLNLTLSKIKNNVSTKNNDNIWLPLPLKLKQNNNIVDSFSNSKLVLNSSMPDKRTLHVSTPSIPSNLLWVGVHAPGVLKSSKFARQTYAGVRAYNEKMYKLLDQWKVPYLDTLAFTKGTVSYDGTHYGWGINMLKVNMILTYFEKTLKPAAGFG